MFDSARATNKQMLTGQQEKVARYYCLKPSTSAFLFRPVRKKKKILHIDANNLLLRRGKLPQYQTAFDIKSVAGLWQARVGLQLEETFSFSVGAACS